MAPFKFVFLLPFVWAVLGSSPKRVFEKREVPPVDWAKSHRPDSEGFIPIQIGLKQANIDRLEEFLTSVSHPKSSQYGQHWTAEQVARTFAPTSETINLVQKWLFDSGISSSRINLSPSRGWLRFNATVSEIEELLDCQYMVYRHANGAEQLGKCVFFSLLSTISPFPATESYSLPEGLHPHVELIMPTLLLAHSDPGTPTHFSLERRQFDDSNIQPGLLRSLGSPSSDSLPKLKGPFTGFSKSTSGSDLATCDEAITPDCLRALYNIQYKPVATHENTFGIGRALYLSLVPVYITTDSSRIHSSSFPSARLGSLLHEFFEKSGFKITDSGIDRRWCRPNH